MRPKLSICITTYNVAPFLHDCLNGVLKQKLNAQYEIIIVDDGSSDGTQAIIREYEEKFPSIIKAHFNTVNLKYARNYLKALSFCTAEYIAVLDGDDYWTDENKLQKQLDFLDKNPDYTLSYHNAIVEEELGHRYTFIKEARPATQSLHHFLANSSNWNSSFVYRNIFKNKFPLWLPNAIHPDFPLHAIHAARGKINYMDATMGVYRQHQNSISRIWDNDREAEFSKNAIFVVTKLKDEVPVEYYADLNLIASRHRDLVAGNYLKKNMYVQFLKNLLISYFVLPLRSIKEYKDSYYHLFFQP